MFRVYASNDLILKLVRSVLTWKSQNKALPYWRSDSEVNTLGRGFKILP